MLWCRSGGYVCHRAPLTAAWAQLGSRVAVTLDSGGWRGAHWTRYDFEGSAARGRVGGARDRGG